MSATAERTLDPALDGERIDRQRDRVFALMADGRWRTLAQIAGATRQPEASVSARLRDFRKPQYGGYQVDRHRVRGARGLWTYRLRLQQPRLF